MYTLLNGWTTNNALQIALITFNKEDNLNLKGNFSPCEIRNTQLTKEIISELPLIATNFSLLPDPNFIIEQSRVKKQENGPNFVSYYITIFGQKYISALAGWAQ